MRKMEHCGLCFDEGAFGRMEVGGIAAPACALARNDVGVGVLRMEVGLPLSQPVRLTAPLTRGAFGRMEVEGDCQKAKRR